MRLVDDKVRLCRDGLRLRDAEAGDRYTPAYVSALERGLALFSREVEVLPDDIGGIAVHAAARVMALGDASEIIVSSVTRGLMDGSDLRFEERGRHQVKGMERPIEVFLLAT